MAFFSLPSSSSLFPPCSAAAGTNLSLPPQHEHDRGKLTVVLDMDETLIHSEIILDHPSSTSPTSEPTSEPTDFFYLPLGPSGLIKVLKRPFLHQFLLEASAQFELIVFTAGTEEYANAVLNQLDPDGRLFRHRLFRQHCTTTSDGFLAKDLRILNRNLQRTVLVDNSHVSFAWPQVDNGVLIPSFFDDPKDNALMRLGDLLSVLTPLADVRHHLAPLFRLRELLWGGRPSPDEV